MFFAYVTLGVSQEKENRLTLPKGFVMRVFNGTGNRT